MESVQYALCRDAFFEPPHLKNPGFRHVTTDWNSAAHNVCGRTCNNPFCSVPFERGGVVVSTANKNLQRVF